MEILKQKRVLFVELSRESSVIPDTCVSKAQTEYVSLYTDLPQQGTAYMQTEDIGIQGTEQGKYICKLNTGHIF